MIILEYVSDAHKKAFKKKNPKRYVDTGLYRMVLRCRVASGIMFKV